MSEKLLPTLGNKPMSLAEAQRLAQLSANQTGSSVLVYRNNANKVKEDYDVSFTLPSFGTLVGDPFEPQKVQS